MRVGQEGQAGTLTYLHGDHLGSTSLATDEAGEELYRRGYYPFGEERYAIGDVVTDYGFTGQREEAYIDLIEMGARWYDSSIGRWISADTIVPDPGNAQSWNRYSYAYSRPLVYIDPNGHDPEVPDIITAIVWFAASVVTGWDHIAPNDPAVQFNKDRVAQPVPAPGQMSAWLVNQMVSNAQSTEVASVQQLRSTGGTIDANAAMQAWTALVGTGNVWDFKVDIQLSNWYRHGGVRDVVLGGKALNYDAVANIHYGFVGRAAGFGGEFLVQAAGFAQFKRYLDYGRPEDLGAVTCYGDHPYATWSIRLGIFLYDKYGPDELNEETFAEGLQLYIDEAGQPPDPPPGAL